MWRLEPSAGPRPADLDRFVQIVNEHASFWEPHTPISVARAPGRLDLMGGIADYSGSLVLQLPLDVATLAAVQPVAEPTITVLSTTAAELGGAPQVTLPLRTLLPIDQPLSYAAARKLLSSSEQSWAGYILGALVVLRRERGLQLDQGLRILIRSSVPPGKGVSSSAALEVATMQALSGALGHALDGRDLALLCQLVEHQIVGAPCGVMDQMTSACGEQGRLLALRCQPAELEPPVALPDAIEVWGIDSGIRHAVSGADYGSVRSGAFMGYRIIAEAAGLPVAQVGAGRVTIADERWGGYLANVTPSEWESHFRALTPEMLDGATFLARYGGFTDSATTIDPERIYAVRQPTAHPIYEHDRVRRFRELLQQPCGEDQLRQLGELMYQSHASYSACGLGAVGTDRLVELVRAAGPAQGLYGAKITGGGSGGTVAVLARRGSRPAVERIAEQYARETGQPPATLLGGSSPGATEIGALRLRAD
jgi:L-arabinokinase